MKKIFLILLLFTSIISVTNAQTIQYNNPKFKDIDKFLLNTNIEPWYNPQPKFRIWVYQQYIVNWIDTLTAQKFCNILWQTYISHILDQVSVNKNVALYYPTSNTWWDYDKNVVRFALINCDNTINTNLNGNTWSGTTWNNTGSWNSFIINNINNDPWINKSVFDDATIIEIYKYEALMMIFILLYRFFQRVTWIRRKTKLMWL